MLRPHRYYSFVSFFAVATGCVVSASACGGASSSSLNTEPARLATASAGNAESVPDASASSGWTCVGNPPDIAAGWQTEVASAPIARPDALGEATRAADQRLRAKLCPTDSAQGAVADACRFLAAHIEPWTTGRNDRDVCASSVVKRQFVDDWRRVSSDLDAFDGRLLESANALLTAANAKVSGKSKDTTPRPTRIALAAVYDDGATDPGKNQLPGGRRADWLASRFRARFASSGGLSVGPRPWAEGEPLPAGFNMVIVGRMYKRSTVEATLVDVAWTGYTADGRQVDVSSGSFPEAAAPAPPAAQPPLLPKSPGLFLSMDSDHFGSICAGETTQLWLKANEPLHVRVFDLYGAGDATLVFPPDAQTSDLVAANRTVPLGDDRGFEAYPIGGSEDERFLVVASPTESGLGELASANRYCRLPSDLAAALHRGERIPPGARTAVTGYRLLTGTGCPAPPSADHARAVVTAVDRLPMCGSN